MSLAAMQDCWGERFPTEANGVSAQTVRLVALAIADVVNDMNDNEFWASSATVAKKIDCHKDTVQDALKHLVSVGVLEVLEKKRGKPTRFRWIGLARVQVDDRHSGTSEGGSPALVPGTTPSDTKGTQDELKPVTTSQADADASAPSKSDRSKAIVDDLWERVKAETGKKPLFKYMGTVKIVEQAVDDWPDGQIADALWRMWSDGRPLILQVLGQYLDGRASKSSNTQRSSNPALDALKKKGMVK